MQAKFKQLDSIDFSRCEQLRNRNLHVLATSNLKIKKLVIGHTIQGAFGKPRVTNKVCHRPLYPDPPHMPSDLAMTQRDLQRL